MQPHPFIATLFAAQVLAGPGMTIQNHRHNTTLVKHPHRTINHHTMTILHDTHVINDTHLTQYNNRSRIVKNVTVTVAAGCTTTEPCPATCLPEQTVFPTLTLAVDYYEEGWGKGLSTGLEPQHTLLPTEGLLPHRAEDLVGKSE